jgi:uncharacterized repeat protein (TIGR01451 family)
MNKKSIFGFAAGGCLLAGLTGGGMYWMQGGKVPTLAVSGAAESGTTADATPTAAKEPAAPEPLRPIPAPANDLADLAMGSASPARFQPPASAEEMSPASSPLGNDVPAVPSPPGETLPASPSAFVPFAETPSPTTARIGDSPPASARIGNGEESPAATDAADISATDSAAGNQQSPTVPTFTSTVGPTATLTSPTDRSSDSAASPPAFSPWNSAPAETSPPLAAEESVPSNRSISGDQQPPAPSSFGPARAATVTPAPAVSHAATLGGATPGPENLEGEQAPAVSLEKIAPPEIQVGKSAVFQSVVRNVGSAPVENVLLVDHVPQGTRLVSTSPQSSPVSDGVLSWKLGTLKPNDEVVVSMEVVPEQEGVIGSVAQVSFPTLASVKTTCTKPQLAVRHTAPDQVLIGDNVVLAIEISNPGTGAATRVTLEEDVPEGLVHPAGKELEYDVGTLLPNEIRKLELPLAADRPGQVTNVLRVRGEGGLVAEHSVQLEVVAPQLQVGVTGPARRYLERQVTYEVSVANPGTAPAGDIDLVAHLPKGLKFIEADQQGEYDSQSHSVMWSVPELPPGQQGVLKFTALPIETGEQKIAVEGRASMGLNHRSEHSTLVEGVTQLQFSITDLQDPIEVEADTAYEIRIANSGTKAATNVRLAVTFPAGMTPVSGEGPTRVTVQGQQASTDPMDELAAGAETVYRVQARGARSGDHVVRVQLSSDDSPNPVTKEEITRVYADE